METLFLVGRILYGGFFLLNGINHFKNRAGLTAYAHSKNVPAAQAAVLISGAMILLGGLGVIFGMYVEISLWLIILFLLLVSFKMHTFWSVPPEHKEAEKINFMKNIALLGAGLMLLSVVDLWELGVNI